MGIDYLSLDDLSKENILKSENSRETFRTAYFTDDNSVNFVTKIGMHLRDNGYYIKKFSNILKDTKSIIPKTVKSKSKSKSEKEEESESNDEVFILDDEETVDGEYYLEDEEAIDYFIEVFIDGDLETEKKEEKKEKKKTEDEINEEKQEYEYEEEEEKQEKEEKQEEEEEEDEEECDEVVQDFKKTLTEHTCKTALGMDEILAAIERNLNHAITILNSKDEEGKKERIPVKTSDIKKLLSQFKIIKKTEWEHPTKHIPKKIEDPHVEDYVEPQRAIFRTKFFDAYETAAKEVLRKFSDNPQGKEAEIAKTILVTIRPLQSDEIHEANTGEYAYKELQTYATSAEKGYDQEYDTREGSIKIKGNFTFETNKDSNTILYRLIAVLLDHSRCTGPLENYVNDVFNGKLFDYEEEPIWVKEKANFGDKKLQEVETIFNGLKEDNPLKNAFCQFYKLVFEKLETSNSLDRTQTEDLIEAFVGEEVECQTVLKFLSSPKIKRDDKYHTLFKKLNPKDSSN